MADGRIIGTAGLLGALAVAAGAFGAHGLAERLDARALELWKTAAHYHLIHAVVLLGAGLLEARLAAIALTAGILVFSGTVYALALGAPRILGAVTPLGGLALIAGWLLLAHTGLRRRGAPTAAHGDAPTPT